ncbi:MAG: ankyrin repeat domain-containing protein [Gemmatimonadota bacterium]|nr:ankyrin repeat domain-containing protein [Gemmatimonadota bacterium]
MTSRPFRITTPAEDATLEAMFKAVRAGDAEGVRAMVKDTPSLVTAYAPNQWCCRETPLNAAAESGLLEMAKLLLDLGADPNQASAWWAGGFRPLHVVPVDREDLIDLLIEQGAVVDVHAAARLGRLEDLTALLDHDPFLLHKPGGDGARPLHFARNETVACLLMDRGALLELPDVDHGSTAAQWAVGDRPSVSRAILDRGAKADVFMLAALGDADRLGAWLEEHPGDAGRYLTREDFPSPGSAGGHIYAYSLAGYGSTVLHTAAKFGSVEAVDLLVGHGADVAARGGYDDQTALHVAAASDRDEAVRALAGHGAELDALSGPEHRTPPLVWAIVFGAARSARALVELGATVDESVRSCAEAGVRGEYRRFSKAPEESWTTILEVLPAP